MRSLKNTKGITLVALIITIIVLLILAMVSIRLIMNGGIIGKANNGVKDYSKAEEKEQIGLGYKEYQMAKFQEVNPQLKVEGAEVTGEGPWTITFAKSGRVYELETDGTIPGGETANLPEDAVVSLAKSGEIQRGDKINYNPGTATTASIKLPKGASIEGKKLASVNLPAGASLEGTINASSATDWVILDVNQTTGEVLIMPKRFSDVNLILNGIDGYNNAIEAINEVASIYKNSAYASLARGITLEDIDKVYNCDKEDPEEITFRHRYGVDENLNIVDAGEDNTPSRTFRIEKRYYANPSSVFGGMGGQFCIANRSLDKETYGNKLMAVKPSIYEYYYGGITKEYGSICKIYKDSSIYEDCYYGRVLPVVILRSDAELVNEGEIEEVATATATQNIGPHHQWSFK